MRKVKFSFLFWVSLFLFSGSVISSDQQSEGLKPLDASGSELVKKWDRADFYLGETPLYFIRNRGQVNEKARFYARAFQYTLWLTSNGLVFDRIGSGKTQTDGKKNLRSRDIPGKDFQRDVSRLSFLNARKDPMVVPLGPASLKVNYFKGNDPSKWKGDVSTSSAVMYRELYNKIDLKVYGIEREIEYDWIVKSGGEPGDIRFEYSHVKGTQIDVDENHPLEGIRVPVHGSGRQWVHHPDTVPVNCVKRKQQRPFCH